MIHNEAKTMEESKEKRRATDRRSGVDRRRINPPRYTGIEKRMDPQCRSGIDRRENREFWSELQTACITKDR